MFMEYQIIQSGSRKPYFTVIKPPAYFWFQESFLCFFCLFLFYVLCYDISYMVAMTQFNHSFIITENDGELIAERVLYKHSHVTFYSSVATRVFVPSVVCMLTLKLLV